MAPRNKIYWDTAKVDGKIREKYTAIKLCSKETSRDSYKFNE
jgi:hypothetical protein